MHMHLAPSAVRDAASAPRSAPLLKSAAYVLNAIWAVPFVIAMRAVRPWVLVRAGAMRSDRIGHFVVDAALYLADRTLKRRDRRVVDLLWFTGLPCNTQWARMVKRTFPTGWWVRYVIAFNRRLPGGAAHDLPPLNASRDVHGTIARAGSRFEFSPAEEERARAWLRRRGWRDGEKFVCLLVRDSAYLASDRMHAGYDWSYHDYRDSRIETYVDAVSALLEKGYWVVRMGKIMHERFPLRHERVIDYPFVDDQDDLLDIWLSANCAFFVSTGTGIDTVAIAYERPAVFVNFNPLGNIVSYARNVCVPKELVWKATGQSLTLREHCEHGYMVDTAGYERAGIGLTDLSAAAIEAAVMECEARVGGTWRETAEDERLQQRFWQALATWSRYSEMHGWRHPQARAGAAWLRSMGDAFLD